MLSDVSVSSVGLLYFRESLSNMKIVGLIFAFTGIVLMSWDSINGNTHRAK